MKSEKKSSVGTVIVAIAVIIVAILIFGNSGANTSKTYTCGSCRKTFSNSADTRSIAMSSMCESCHDNFKYTQELKEKLNKSNERY